MSPKNAILILIIMASLSFGTLFYLVKTRRPINRVENIHSTIDLADKRQEENIIIGTSPKERAIEAMSNIKKNNPITEESRQVAIDAMNNMKNNNLSIKENKQEIIENMENTETEDMENIQNN